MSSSGTPESDISETKLCRNSRGVHSFGARFAEGGTAGPRLGNPDDARRVPCHAGLPPANGGPVGACVFCLIRDGEAAHSLVHSAAKQATPAPATTAKATRLPHGTAEERQPPIR
ncbi:hypothetical protein GCM10023224_06620 [Streptomonospora halophila]|uniref:Uncharacterized protein n=1 Tax=Streptomonospora halophila TaxID=427369 RepID=A0ABP9G632_9ACTN